MPTPKIHDSDADRAAVYRARKQSARLADLQAKGLPPLPAIPTMPGKRRWSLLAQMGSFAFTTIHAEMEGYYNDRSESWQVGEKGEHIQDCLERLESLLTDIHQLDI